MAARHDPGNHLYVGTYGHVIALHKKTGRRVWKTSLPMTGYSVVSIVHEDDTLFCASGGRVFGLEPRTGEIVWTNGLRGLGTGQVHLATVASGAGGIAAILADERYDRSRTAGSSGASTAALH